MRLFLLVAMAIAMSFFVPHDLYASAAAPILKPIIKQGLKAGEEALEQGGKQVFKNGVKHTIGGDSTKLAKTLGIVPKSGYQAHHIIPVECANHRTLNKIGFELDKASNGIALPGRDGLTDKLPVHRGYHSSYNNAVRRDLDAIPASLSEAETAKRVTDVMNKYRKMIESGKLNNLQEIGAPDAWR